MHRLALSMIAAWLLVSATWAQGPVVAGTVTYRERVLLRPGAVLEVTLEDVSRADWSAPVVAALRVENPGEVPLRFELPYDPLRIQPAHRYAVRARILEGGGVRFRTTGDVLAVTLGHGLSVDLVLMAEPSALRAPAPSRTVLPASGSARRPEPVRLTGLPASFTGILPCSKCPGTRVELNLFPDDSYVLRATDLGQPAREPRDEIGSWTLSSDRRVLVLQAGVDVPDFYAIRDGLTLRKLDADGLEPRGRPSADLRRAAAFRPIEVQLAMRGAYRAAEGQAEFVECSSGQRWVVDASGAADDLAARYHAAVGGTGGTVVVGMHGRVRPRPLAPGVLASLVVEQVADVSTGAQCEARFAGIPLERTTWRLTRLGPGNAPGASADALGAAALTFRPDPAAFSVSSGCSRFAGTYHVSGEEIGLTIAGTMQTCPQPVDVALAAALKETRRFRVLGPTLDFYGAGDEIIARFRADTD